MTSWPTAPQHGVLDVTPDGESVRCHECGEWVRGISVHARMSHGIGAGEYRKRHGLPSALPLTAPAYSRMRSRASRAKVGTKQWIAFRGQRSEPSQSPTPSRLRAERLRRKHLRVVEREAECEACGKRFTPGTDRKTCSKECMEQLKSSFMTMRAQARSTPMADADRARLLGTPPDDLQPVVAALYRKGVSSREIAETLGWTRARLSKRFPRRIAAP